MVSFVANDAVFACLLSSQVRCIRLHWSIAFAEYDELLSRDIERRRGEREERTRTKADSLPLVRRR